MMPARSMLSLSRQTRGLLTSLLLVALLARALVPVGFMPATSGSGGMVLCPAGMLMPAADAQRMDGNAAHGVHLHVEYCPYGSAPFAAPVPHWAFVPAVMPVNPPPLQRPAPSRLAVRSARANQPRAPPSPV